jgi:hypothetical protein
MRTFLDNLKLRLDSDPDACIEVGRAEWEKSGFFIPKYKEYPSFRQLMCWAEDNGYQAYLRQENFNVVISR